jgi:hypothetical protein
MLSRVLRRDQVLAVLSVAGVVAGLALVILTKLKVTGIIVITSGLVAAVAIAVPKAIESLADLKERQRDQDDRIRSILVGGEPLPLADVDPIRDRSVSLAHRRGERTQPRCPRVCPAHPR